MDEHHLEMDLARCLRFVCNLGAWNITKLLSGRQTRAGLRQYHWRPAHGSPTGKVDYQLINYLTRRLSKGHPQRVQVVWRGFMITHCTCGTQLIFFCDPMLEFYYISEVGILKLNFLDQGIQSTPNLTAKRHGHE